MDEYQKLKTDKQAILKINSAMKQNEKAKHFLTKYNNIKAEVNRFYMKKANLTELSLVLNMVRSNRLQTLSKEISELGKKNSRAQWQTQDC